MLRKKEKIILLVVCCCLGTAFCENQSEQPNPHENTPVLAEAFMIRVSNEALLENGVNPIGQAPEGVSILKILACLDDPEKAEVISGAKVTARHNNEAQTRNSETFYIKRESVSVKVGKEGPIESKSVNFDAYTSGKTFNVVPWIQPDEKIRLEASYSDTGVIENEDRTTPPTQLKYDWSGTLVMQSGIPIIAGASQNNDAIIFLILTATIQEAQATEQKKYPIQRKDLYKTLHFSDVRHCIILGRLTAPKGSFDVDTRCVTIITEPPGATVTQINPFHQTPTSLGQTPITDRSVMVVSKITKMKNLPFHETKNLMEQVGNVVVCIEKDGYETYHGTLGTVPQETVVHIIKLHPKEIDSK